MQNQAKHAITARLTGYLVACAMCLWGCPAHAGAVPSAGTVYVVVEAGSTLNGRTEPSKRGEVCARFECGDALNTVDYQAGWYSVIGSEYGTCWVSADYVSSEPPTDAPSSAVIASSGRVALRDKPDGKRIAWMHNGDCVTVASVVIVGGTRWARVDGGYVKAEYVDTSAQNEVAQ